MSQHLRVLRVDKCWLRSSALIYSGKCRYFFFNWKDGLATYVRIFSLSPDIQAEVKKNFWIAAPSTKRKKKKKLIFRQHACISEFACKVEERMPHDAKTNLQNYSVFYNRKMPERKLNLLQLSCDNPPTAENPANLGDDQTNWFRSGHRWKQKDIHHSVDLIWEIFMVCSPAV